MYDIIRSISRFVRILFAFFFLTGCFCAIVRWFASCCTTKPFYQTVFARSQLKNVVVHLRFVRKWNNSVSHLWEEVWLPYHILIIGRSPWIVYVFSFIQWNDGDYISCFINFSVACAKYEYTFGWSIFMVFVLMRSDTNRFEICRWIIFPQTI